MADGWQHLSSTIADLPVAVREEILAFAAEIEIAARMAEREWCATIAENGAHSFPVTDFDPDCMGCSAAKRIAVKIRSAE